MGAILGMLGQQAIGAGMGIMMEKGQNKRQLKQQEKLQALQLKGNKQMLDWQAAKELEMWKNTSYPAQMAMMKEAGLNPALMYGMGGGGGTTVGGNSENVYSTTATGASPQGMAGAGMGLMMNAQVELLKAQKENIEADTADKLGGAALKGAQKGNVEVDTSLKDVELKIKGRTWDDQVDIIGSEAQIKFEEAERLNRENRFGKEAYETKLKTIKQEYALLIVETGLKEAMTITERGKPAVQKAEIGLMTEQADAVLRTVNLGYEKLFQDGIRYGYETRESAQRKLVNDVAESERMPIEMAEKIVQALLLKGLLGTKNEPIKGFRR